jgi:hypothetical protein
MCDMVHETSWLSFKSAVSNGLLLHPDKNLLIANLSVTREQTMGLWEG